LSTGTSREEIDMANNQQPTHRVYTVVKREGQDDFWLPIGAAFAHQDGKGFNIMLQALPTDGKVVLREPKDGSDEGSPSSEKLDNVRPIKNRRGR
jgi:hypothetical protein